MVAPLVIIWSIWVWGGDVVAGELEVNSYPAA